MAWASDEGLYTRPRLPGSRPPVIVIFLPVKFQSPL